MKTVMKKLNVTVMKRNGASVAFDRAKIEEALMKCFMDPKVLGPDAGKSASVRTKVVSFTDTVIAAIIDLGRGSVQIEEVQDLVEKTLMNAGEHTAMREYVIFRTTRARERDQQASLPVQTMPRMKKADGTLVALDEAALFALVNDAAAGLSGVDPVAIVRAAVKDLFDGFNQKAIDDALELSARALIETEPNYTYLAARLAMVKTRREVYGLLGIIGSDRKDSVASTYPTMFARGLELGVKRDWLSPKLLDGRFDIKELGSALVPDRDGQYDYLGFQTLYDRYFGHVDKVPFELPQTMLMRIAMGMALQEDNPTARAIEFYELLSTQDFMSSTPTLFNSGTIRSQLSSCYLTTVPDDLFGIFGAVQDNAMLSKFAGGLGNDWTPVRSMNSYIQGTNGKSQGVVPFLKVANDTAVAVNQGGKRKGAVCAYLETWHGDISEFLDLRKNTGDDRRRTHDMNTANWVPDLFMERVLGNGSWGLFSPHEVPELHDLTGDAFRAKYEEYERKGEAGELATYKKVEAVALWRNMLSKLFETGHPWITFKDPCNIRSPQQHVGVVHSSNLCTEITLNTKAGEEIAVCNLGSVNVPAHIIDGKLDLEKLERTTTVAMRMLDNVIDENYYAVEAARRSNLRHRPVGLGIMGFQDALYMLRIPYESDAAVEFADTLMEYISYFAIKASADLADQRGAYESFPGSLWSRGILPIDSVALLKSQRKLGHMSMDNRSHTDLDWKGLRQKVQKGMRNSNCMAIAPTATIANITHVSQSIEPTYQNLYVKSNLSGEFTVVNEYLANDLKALGLWDAMMVQDLKFYDGSVQKIDRVPADLKELYRCAFEVDPKRLVDAAARRQKWIDQAQSLNLYMREPNGKKLDELYKHAWLSGLKTTYYLRTMGATSAEKTTIQDNRLNAVSSGKAGGPSPVLAPKPVPEMASVPATDVGGSKVCSILDPGCESCQ